ncbi:efflux RND transporter periplasmic adaptor subunit [bacterium]|nr:efflux RND transporter periplasmic adaptor subunit [candidate division CSSED10-310 bacterium]
MKHIKTAGIILSAVLIIWGVNRLLGNAQSAKLPPMMGGESGVRVETVATRRFETRIEAIGTAYAKESVDITAMASGRVTEILFENSAGVRAGDILVKLDDAEERAEVEEARIDLAEQQRELERIRELRGKKMASQKELEVCQNAVGMAAARLTAAQARLEDRRIAAPFSGTLGIRRISLGALVNPGTVITTLDDLEVIKAEFSIPEIMLAEIAVGQEIEAASAAWPGELFTGVVASIDSRVDPATRAIIVQANIPNPDHRFRPGMLLTVTLICRSRDVAGVREAALTAFADHHFAFIVKRDSTVERRELRIGAREYGWVEILNGVETGEQVVVDGLMDLRDGARVHIVSMDPADLNPQEAVAS